MRLARGSSGLHSGTDPLVARLPSSSDGAFGSRADDYVDFDWRAAPRPRTSGVERLGVRGVQRKTGS